MKTVFLIFFALTSSCSFFGQKEVSDNIESIELGYSFGECDGYCKAQLIVEPSWQTLTLTSWSLTDTLRVFKSELSSNDWQIILSSTKLEAFCAMDDVYGCPDCADGGAEWVSMKCDGEEKRVTFDYGVDLPELSELLELLRPIRENLNQDE